MKKNLLVFLLLLCVSAAWSQRSVSGTVKDGETGETMPGVSVAVKGTTVGTITDIDGKFELKVNDNSSVVTFSFIGYTTYDLKVGNQTIFSIALQTSSQQVDEVVVVGYITQRREAITGSVSVVRASELEGIAVASVDQALQGKVAGVHSVASSGRPGAGANVKIRGVGSLSAGSSPLYVIDGMPVETGNFSTINTSDIASISVLKDAASTAIYGSKGANGVIIITTKKGRFSKKPIVEVSAKMGVSMRTTDKLSLMNATQKLDYEEQVGIRIPGTYNKERLIGYNTKWSDEVFRDNAPSQEANLAVSGGNKDTKYRLSAGYYSEDGIMINSGMERFTTAFNLNQSYKDIVKFGISTNVGFEEHDYTYDWGINTNSPGLQVYLINPYSPVRNEDGSYSRDNVFNSNSIEELGLNLNERDKFKFLANTYVEIKPFEGLKLTSRYGVDFYESNSKTFYAPSSKLGLQAVGKKGSSSRYYSRYIKLMALNTIDYKLEFLDDHIVTAIAGNEITTYNNKSSNLTAIKFASDKLTNANSGAEPESVGSSETNWASVSYFALVTYEYLERYNFQASFRTDGSSRFGKNNRWGNFWSVSAGWILSNEEFLEDNDYVNFLKIRGGVGTVGNDQIGNFNHLGLYSFSPTYDGQPGSAPSQFANPELTWEKHTQSSIAIEFALLDDMITGTVEAYQDKATSMLYSKNLSLVTGFSSLLLNIGEITKKGLELDLSIKILDDDFKWSVSGNIAYMTDQIDDLGGQEEEVSGSAINRVGEPQRVFYLSRFAGVNPANGESLWYDKDNKLTNVFSEDNNVMLSGKTAAPSLMGGFGTSMSYKGFKLDVMFSYEYDKYILNNLRYFIESNGTFSGYNQNLNMLTDSWVKPGDHTTVPKYGNAMKFDTRLLEDGSFLRLREVKLSYSFSEDLIEGLFMKKASIFVQGLNLLTFTEFTGFDPETASEVDKAPYPVPMKLLFGLNITF